MPLSQPNPHTTTREAYTEALVGDAVPTNASPKFAKLFNSLNDLYSKLAHHPAMAPNLQQTFMTPANSKNKVYFMWDFVGRTRGLMALVDPSLPEKDKEQWDDIAQRAIYGDVLVQDTTGKTEVMFAGCAPADFGDEVKAASKEVVKNVDMWDE